MGCKISFRFMTVILSLLLKGTSAWIVSEKENCAEIYFQPEFQGRSLQLKDIEQVVDLSYVESKYFQINGNTSMSLKIHPGCNLILADKPFMKGKQFLFQSDVLDFDRSALFPKSAACTCPQICKCANLILRNRECARAYLGQECENCDAYFTSLSSVGGVRPFPPKWKDNVASLIVRRGCTLILDTERTQGVDDEEEVTKEQVTISSIQDAIGNITLNNSVETEWNATIINYDCQCNSSYASKRVPKPINSVNSKYPRLITIPKSKKDLLSLLSQDGMKNHPGVMSAFQSLKNKRSSTNAYILLIGLTGSGKSTAINMLFDHPNITKIGGMHSTTTDILEFRIRIKLDELGISNSELRVIDTPGTSDTRGIVQDSRFLATLEDYLDNHEDLKDIVPNLVLVFSKFHDNRFRGEGSSFVKMLRTIDLFKDRIIDRKYTNVVFVLSHFMSETSLITQNPEERINAVRKVVEEFSTLPKPIHIVVAENKPEEFHLPSLNGFYKLPNGDLYPQNLFSQIQSSLVTSGDPIGEAVIRLGFKNSDKFNIIGKTCKLVGESNPKVTKYMGILRSFDTSLTSTQVSRELSESYNKLEDDLKSEFPGVLNHLQRILFHNNIHEPNQLPKTRQNVLKFFEDIPINEASIALLRDSFNLTIPLFSGETIVGCGYDLINDAVLPTPLFSIDTVTPSEINFQIPQGYNLEMCNRMENVFYILTSRDAYANMRLNSLGLDEDSFPSETISPSLKLKDGYNIINQEDSTDQLTESGGLSAVLEYHMFQMKLGKVEISSEFTSAVESLTPLNLEDFDSFTQWNGFFRKYGTHVVTSAFGGGRIKIEVELNPDVNRISKTEQYTILTKSMSQIVQNLADSFIGKDPSALKLASGVTHKISFEGGDTKFSSTLDIDNWKDSVRYNPVMLSSTLELLSISEVARQLTTLSKGEEKAVLIEDAASSLFNASLVYIPVSRVNTGSMSREHTVSGFEAGIGGYEAITEFASIFKSMAAEGTKMQEKLISLMQQRQADADKIVELDMAEAASKKQFDLEQERLRKADEMDERQLAIQLEQLHSQRLAKLEEIRVQRLQAQTELNNNMQIAASNSQAEQQAMLLNFINSESDRRLQLSLNRKSVLDKIGDFTGKLIDGGRTALMTMAPFMG